PAQQVLGNVFQPKSKLLHQRIHCLEGLAFFALLPVFAGGLSWTKLDALQSFAHQGEGVCQTFACTRPRHRFLDQLAEPLLECDETAHEVAAVHSRNVAGLQRAQSASVVPVIEVALVTLQSLKRGERFLQALHQAWYAQVTEIVS